MPHAKATLHWIVLEHEDDEFPVLPDTRPLAPQRSRVRTVLALGVCALLTSLILGGRVLVTAADEGLATIGRELEATIALEEWPASPPQAVDPARASRPPATGPDIDSIAAAPTGSAQTTHAQLLDVTPHGDLAVAEVLETHTYAGGQSSALRKLRFYRHDGVEWVPSAPDDAYRGRSFTLETERLVFTYRQRDRAVVESAALLMEDAYAAMHQALGLPPPVGKLKIAVGLSSDRAFIPLLRGDILYMTSPSLMPLPADLPPDQLLAWQALPLLAEYMIDETEAITPVQANWDFMTRVVAHWLVLQRHNLQATWLADVRQWQCSQCAAPDLDDAPGTTDALAAACIKHRIDERKLWFINSGAVLTCTTVDNEPFMGCIYSPLPFKLRGFLTENSANAPCGFSFQPAPLLAATLLDYAVTGYGPDAVAKLWHGFHAYSNWDELIPAEFGVSAEEFEDGWQAYPICTASESSAQ